MMTREIDASVQFWIKVSAVLGQGYCHRHGDEASVCQSESWPKVYTSTLLLTSLKMLGCRSTIIYPPLGQHHGKQIQIMTFLSLISAQTCELIGLDSNRRRSPIHILNDDVLLHVFHLYRLAEPDERYDARSGMVISWLGQRWWYKLAHVCRQWRNIILDSPSRLDLHLLCTNGVPVADMLTHSPPLPLTISYDAIHRGMTAEDESSILLALSHRDRVRRICFWMLTNVDKFVTVMDDQFPILERMYIDSRTEVVLPVTFQAPNLRRLRLKRACIPIRSPLLTTATGLVALILLHIPASAYFPPSYIRTRLSLMLKLEILTIGFKSPIPSRDVQRQSRQTLNMITLPNLHRFVFNGVSAYLEALIARISAPSLNVVHVYIFNQLSFTLPRLLQFMQIPENLRFTAVQVTFGALAVSLHAVPWTWNTPLRLGIKCGHLDWQVSSAVQFFGTLSPVLSTVEQVTFSYEVHKESSESHINIDRRQWRELLRPFTNARTIHVQDDLVTKLFRSLPSDDGEPPLELLPNLEEVEYSGGRDNLEEFTAFLSERKVAGHPVSLRLVDRRMFEEPKGYNV
jgi:F-box-like